MTEETLIPRKERLLQAVQWLGEQGHVDVNVIEEACKRFDLSPKDEDFLLDEWHKRKADSASRR
jgi:hypothetical protein